LPPRELFIVDDGNGTRKIRFSTTVANLGEGPLDLTGRPDATGATITATQRIFLDDGSADEKVVGTFMFHPAHVHWHFEDFTVLELWTYDGSGELDRLLRTTGKATFCALDEVLAYPELPNVPEGPSYLECGDETQGISVGWSDTYGAEIAGQELDISGVPDGRYAIRSTADPAGRLIEMNDTNNSVIVYVDIHGGDIDVLSGGG
jgi:hypothetical protein